MKILAIETSCDETAVTMLEAWGDETHAKYAVLGNGLYSQSSSHARFGGVYPSLAKREHAKNLVPLLVEAMREAGVYHNARRDISAHVVEELSRTLSREPGLFQDLVGLLASMKQPDIDAIAVTSGPGLEPALWVGITFAQALSAAWHLPIIPTNHLEGHLIASLARESAKWQYELERVAFPVIGLIISGGHTELMLIRSSLEYETVGTTRDDAVGEAFDKVARMLNLPYPGGVHLSNLAEQARHFGHGHWHHPESTSCTLPRPMIGADNLDFSFAGLKTAVLYMLKKIPDINDETRKHIAKEFEDAVADVLIEKVSKAVRLYDARTVMIGGGVSANKHIRERFETLVKEELQDVVLLLPRRELTTDNAIMIGMAAYLHHLKGDVLAPEERHTISAKGRMPLDRHAVPVMEEAYPIEKPQSLI